MVHRSGIDSVLISVGMTRNLESLSFESMFIEGHEGLRFLLVPDQGTGPGAQARCSGPGAQALGCPAPQLRAAVTGSGTLTPSHRMV